MKEGIDYMPSDDRWNHEAKCDCSNCKHLEKEVSKYNKAECTCSTCTYIKEEAFIHNKYRLDVNEAIADRSTNRSITYPYSTNYKLIKD